MKVTMALAGRGVLDAGFTPHNTRGFLAVQIKKRARFAVASETLCSAASLAAVLSFRSF